MKAAIWDGKTETIWIHSKTNSDFMLNHGDDIVKTDTVPYAHRVLRGVNCSGIEWRVANFGLEYAKKGL